MVTNQTKFKQGTGGSIRFWLDEWLGVQLFCVRFPEIYRISTDKRGSVQSHISIACSQWDLNLRKGMKDQEFGQIQALLTLLPPCNLGAREDILLWKTGTANLTVKETAVRLDASFYLSDACEEVWAKNIPSIFFSHLDSLPTQDLNHGFTKERGMQLARRCPLCRGNEETAHHLLWECPFAAHIFNSTLSPFGIKLKEHQPLNDLIQNRMCRRVDELGKVIWNAYYHR